MQFLPFLHIEVYHVNTRPFNDLNKTHAKVVIFWWLFFVLFADFMIIILILENLFICIFTVHFLYVLFIGRRKQTKHSLGTRPQCKEVTCVSVSADLSDLQAKFTRHCGRTLLLHVIPLKRRIDAVWNVSHTREFRFTPDCPFKFVYNAKMNESKTKINGKKNKKKGLKRITVFARFSAPTLSLVSYPKKKKARQSAVSTHRTVIIIIRVYTRGGGKKNECYGYEKSGLYCTSLLFGWATHVTYRLYMRRQTTKMTQSSGQPLPQLHSLEQEEEKLRNLLAVTWRRDGKGSRCDSVSGEQRYDIDLYSHQHRCNHVGYVKREKKNREEKLLLFCFGFVTCTPSWPCL